MSKIFSTLLLLGFASTISACAPAEENLEQASKIEGKRNNEYLLELAAERVSRYRVTKQWGEKLNFNTSCETADSTTNAENTEIADFIIQTNCSDISLTNYVNKTFLIEKGGQEKMVSILCYSDGYSYLTPSSMLEDIFRNIARKRESEVKNKLTPSLISNYFPSCPKDKNGKELVISAYKDYSIPLKEYAFSNESEVVQELESIAEEQIEQYDRANQISLMLETNSACGRYSSTLIGEGGIVAVNYAEPKYLCYGDYANKSFQDSVYATVLSKEADGSLSYKLCTYSSSSKLIEQLMGKADSNQSFSCGS